MHTLDKIAKILHIENFRRLPISYFTIDSRLCRKGALFFALKGEKTDGHAYLEEAAQKGAFAAVVNENYRGLDYGLVLLKVNDVLQALHALGKTIYGEIDAKVIGITGSIGKTTTKEFLYTMLEKKWKVHKNDRSFNSQSTYPLTLLNTPLDAQILILEMGMSKKGQIKNLTEMAPADVVILTPIVMNHINHFESLDEIAEAKCEIFHSRNEFCVIHENNLKFPCVREHILSSNVIYPGYTEVKSPFHEVQFKDAFHAAYEVATHLGMMPSEIEERLYFLKPFEHRYEKKQYKGILFVDDSYNANPVTTLAALKHLPSPKAGSKTIFVFGSMAELGKYSKMSHEEVAKEALSKIDLLLAIGEEVLPSVKFFEKAGKKVEYFSSYDALKQSLQLHAKSGDVVLVKGSNYHKLWEIIDYI